MGIYYPYVQLLATRCRGAHEEGPSLFSRLKGRRALARAGYSGQMSTQLQTQVPVPAPSRALQAVESPGTAVATTLDYDLKRKAGIYAKAGIKEYWVLDLNARRLHVFTRPVGGIWKQHRTLTPREEVQSATVPELKLKVSELFV